MSISLFLQSSVTLVLILNLSNSNSPQPIAAGKLNRFISENTLLNQEWIMDPKKKVKDIIKEITTKEKIVVKKFVRFKVGEGI